MGSREWSFLLSAVVSIAVGVGANSAIFTVTNGLWLRPLGVVEPARAGLVYFQPEWRADGAVLVSAPAREALRLRAITRATVAFEVIAASELSTWMNPRVGLASGEALQTATVSHNYFETLGVTVDGQAFSDADDTADRRVGIVSSRFARSHFGSRSGTVGRTIATNRGHLKIIGVTSPTFTGTRLGEHIDIWIPLGSAPTFGGLPRESTGLPLAPIIRINSGQDWPAVRAELEELTGGRALVFSLANLRFQPSSLGALGRQDELIFVLRVVAALTMMAACLNLSGLLVTRVDSKRHEIAVHLALGARRIDIIWMVAWDAIRLVAIALPFSLVASYLLTSSIKHLTLPSGIAIDSLDLTIDWRVFLFGLSVATVAAICSAMASLGQVLRAQPRDLLTGSAFGGDRRSWRLRHGLVASHVAVSIVVLTAAASLVARVSSLALSNQGMSTRSVLLSSISPSVVDYLPVSEEGAQRVLTDFRLALDRARSLAGVETVSYGDAPMAGQGAFATDRVETVEGVTQVPTVVIRGGPSYLSAIGAHLIAGRDLITADLGGVRTTVVPRSPNAPNGPLSGAVVNEALASRLWPNGNAIGSFIQLAGHRCVVVGVVRDLLPDLPDRIRAATVIVGVQPSGMLGQTLPPLIVRSAFGTSGLSELDKAVRASFVGATSVRTQALSTRIDEAVGNERLGARFFGWLGIAAGLLALLGIYGLVILNVMNRKYELALRMALGASERSLRWLSIRQATGTVAAGICVGLAAARLMSYTLTASVVSLEGLPVSSYVIAVSVFAVGGSISAYLGTTRIRPSSVHQLLRGSGN